MRKVLKLACLILLVGSAFAGNVQFVGNGCASGTSCTVTLNQATGAGNLLLIGFASSGPSGTPCTDSGGETYVVLDSTPTTTFCYVAQSASGVTTVTVHALASSGYDVIFEEWSPTAGTHWAIDQNPGPANCSASLYTSLTTGTQSMQQDLAFGLIGIAQNSLSGIGPVNTPPTWQSLVSGGGNGFAIREAHAGLGTSTSAVTISGTNTTGFSVCADVYTFQQLMPFTGEVPRHDPGVF